MRDMYLSGQRVWSLGQSIQAGQFVAQFCPFGIAVLLAMGLLAFNFAAGAFDKVLAVGEGERDAGEDEGTVQRKQISKAGRDIAVLQARIGGRRPAVVLQQGRDGALSDVPAGAYHFEEGAEIQLLILYLSELLVCVLSHST